MIPRFFIDRPVFASVIALLTVVAGLVALPALPVEQFPTITPPTVNISTFYPGASAETLVDTVTAPIEQRINGVEGMIYMSSTSASSGNVRITCTFEPGTDPDLAAVRLQNRLAVVEPRLPDEVRRQGITVTKSSPGLLAAISLISPDERYDQLLLSNYATLYVKDRLARVPGVGDVQIFGAEDFSMRVWLDPDLLAERGLTTLDVINALREQNVQVAAGQLGAPPTEKTISFQYTVDVRGRLRTADEFAAVILKTTPDGAILRLGDVAKVDLGAQSYDSFSRRNGKPAATLGIFQLPGSNAVTTVRGVTAAMEELAASFPEGITQEMTFDFTKFIRSSIREVLFTLGLAVLLVIAVIFVFLQDWRTTLIPMLTIPVSLVGTLAALRLVGFSLNLLTLFAMILAIGIVVDDAIIVVENASRILESEEISPRDAAKKAMDEITAPIIAITLVLMAVFIPAAGLAGLTGELYRQFALTIAFSTLLSAICALTLSPALCALLLRRPPDRRNILARAFNRVYGGGAALYERVVGGAVRLLGVMCALFVVLAALAVWLLWYLPSGFIPKEDQGYLLLNVQLPDAASLSRTDEVMRRAESILAGTEGVSTVITVGGFSFLSNESAPNFGTAFVILDDWDERSVSADEIVAALRPRLGAVREASIIVIQPPAIQGLGRAGGFQLELQDRGAHGPDALQEVAVGLIERGNADPELQQLYTTFSASVPRVFVDVDRTEAKRLGVPLGVIFDTLQTNLGSTFVNEFNMFGRVYRVYAQAEARFREEAVDIGRLEVRNAEGRMLPLRSVATVRDTVGPLSISRYNLFPAVSITGQVAGRAGSGTAIARMERLAEEVLPSGFGYEWTGATYQEIRAGSQAPIAFGLGVVVVFLVLAALYESWSIPFAILLSIPLGVLGALAGLAVRGIDDNIYTQIGLVLLIALLAKNAILIVQFAREGRRSGRPVREAAVVAARLRLRPILMTSFAFILGVLPLVFATGAGAAGRRSIGTAVCAGLLIATLTGVLFVPAFFVIIQSLVERMRGRHGGAA
jgi:HAE1 family hydrophobic/amphiphilic exporter-1